MKNKILNPFSIFIIGALSGYASKLFDIYTEILGNIFWVCYLNFLGTLISIYSDTKRKSHG